MNFTDSAVRIRAKDTREVLFRALDNAVYAELQDRGLIPSRRSAQQNHSWIKLHDKPTPRLEIEFCYEDNLSQEKLTERDARIDALHDSARKAVDAVKLPVQRKRAMVTCNRQEIGGAPCRILSIRVRDFGQLVGIVNGLVGAKHQLSAERVGSLLDPLIRDSYPGI